MNGLTWMTVIFSYQICGSQKIVVDRLPTTATQIFKNQSTWVTFVQLSLPAYWNVSNIYTIKKHPLRQAIELIFSLPFVLHDIWIRLSCIIVNFRNFHVQWLQFFLNVAFGALVWYSFVIDRKYCAGTFEYLKNILNFFPSYIFKCF